MAASVTHRFLRYVAIDTQSDATSPTQPSTEKQKNLGRLLVEELIEIGVSDAHLDEHGYVYATIPSNSHKNNVPVICFCAHMDTAPDFSGTNVRPQVVRNYRGGDIRLPGDPDRIIGVAEIMAAAEFLIENPDVRHGTIRILFTTDEEIGRGVDKVDLGKLGADFGYTMDGETAGTVEDETFSADAVEIAIRGVAIHPGFAYGRMENAIRIAGAIIERLPEDMAPETTTGRQGFIHPTGVSGVMEKAHLSFIIRDFTEEGLKTKEALLEGIAREVMEDYPGSGYTLA